MAYQFDGINRLIYILSPTTTFDAQDLYSEWKRWVVSDLNNAKYPQAMRSIGGDPISQTKYIAPYIEVMVNNGWRIKPYSGTYTLTVQGNLFGTGGQNPFIGADSGTVTVILETTGNAIALQTSDSNVSDSLAPTWIGAVGITDAYQNGEFINISWGTASDQSGVVRYRVYISTSEAMLWDSISLLGEFDSNFYTIGTEADGLTKLRDGVTYYIGVRAVDKYDNETTNTNYATITYQAPYDIQSDLTQIKSMLNTLLDVEQGDWQIVNNQMIFYKRDGTELMRFNLYDKSGNPSETDVYKRERV